MIQLSNLNKIPILFFIIFYSCNDKNVNYVACSPNQILDSCGQCYYSQQDENWNNCLDECEVQYGGNICDLEGVLSGDCDCSGCPQFGDPAYCEDCLVDDYCSCNYNQLLSNFPVNMTSFKPRPKVKILLLKDSKYVSSIAPASSNNVLSALFLNLAYASRIHSIPLLSNIVPQ